MRGGRELISFCASIVLIIDPHNQKIRLDFLEGMPDSEQGNLAPTHLLVRPLVGFVAESEVE